MQYSLQGMKTGHIGFRFIYALMLLIYLVIQTALTVFLTL